MNTIQKKMLDDFPIEDARAPFPNVVDVVGGTECPRAARPRSAFGFDASSAEHVGEALPIGIDDGKILGTERVRQGSLESNAAVIVAAAAECLVPTAEKQKGGRDEVGFSIRRRKRNGQHPIAVRGERCAARIERPTLLEERERIRRTGYLQDVLSGVAVSRSAVDDARFVAGPVRLKPERDEERFKGIPRARCIRRRNGGSA